MGVVIVDREVKIVYLLLRIFQRNTMGGFTSFCGEVAESLWGAIFLWRCSDHVNEVWISTRVFKPY